MNNLFSVKDKVVVVTGGGGILCGTMAKALAADGAKVAILDLFEAAAAKVADEIKAKGGKAIPVACNVLDKAAVEQARDKVIAAFGRVDILINGAGGNKKEATTSPQTSFFDLPADAVRFVFDLNFLGTLLPTQVFGKLMAEPERGQHPQHLQHERAAAPDEDPGVLGRQGRDQQLHAVAGRAHVPELLLRTSASTPSRRASS